LRAGFTGEDLELLSVGGADHKRVQTGAVFLKERFVLFARRDFGNLLNAGFMQFSRDNRIVKDGQRAFAAVGFAVE